MSIVNVEKVSRIYRQDSIAVKALDEVSVAIEAGEFTTLVGPSGSGENHAIESDWSPGRAG